VVLAGQMEQTGILALDGEPIQARRTGRSLPEGIRSYLWESDALVARAGVVGETMVGMTRLLYRLLTWLRERLCPVQVRLDKYVR